MSFTTGKRVTNQKPCKADADMDILIANAEDLITKTSSLSICRMGTIVQTIPNNVNTKVIFSNPAILDTDSYFNNATPTRLTIPSGYSYAQINMVFIFSAVDGIIQLLKNNAAFNGAPVSEFDGMSYVVMSSPVLAVSAADYFEASAYQHSGSDASLNCEIIIRGWK